MMKEKNRRRKKKKSVCCILQLVIPYIGRTVLFRLVINNSMKLTKNGLHAYLTQGKKVLEIKY